MRRLGKTLMVMMLAIEFLVVPLNSHLVSAAGNLYITPSASPQRPVGSTFSVQVKVAGIDPFNGWEIQVVSDPSVVKATSISATGNILQANTTGGIGFELRNCVNGTGSGCCLINSCSPPDGVGTADSAYADTRSVSGFGLLFNVTFRLVSSKPYSPITIQNDELSNGGGTGVAHTITSGTYGSSTSIAVSKFFTDETFNPLALDNKRNPSVNVLLVKGGVVVSTNPGQILAWAGITNGGQTALQSLRLNDTLPIHWVIHPSWIPATGAIHVYYANTTSLATNPDITDPTTITVSTGNPQTVSLTIQNLSNTGIGHALLPGQSILLSVKLDYGLKQTSQKFATYPRNYSDTSSAAGFTQATYSGTGASAKGAAFFVAYAKPLGDLNGDGVVNILDLGLVLGANGSTPGTPNWLPSADFNNDGSVGVDDINIFIANYNYSTTSSS